MREYKQGLSHNLKKLKHNDKGNSVLQNRFYEEMILKGTLFIAMPVCTVHEKLPYVLWKELVYAAENISL